MHTVHMLFVGTSYALFIEVVDHLWDDGCLGHVGSRRVHRQGNPRERMAAIPLSRVCILPAREKSCSPEGTTSWNCGKRFCAANPVAAVWGPIGMHARMCFPLPQPQLRSGGTPALTQVTLGGASLSRKGPMDTALITPAQLVGQTRP